MEPKIFVQKAYFSIVCLAIVCIFIVATALVNQDIDTIPMFIVTVIIILSITMMYKMTICVDNEYVWFSMGIGLVRSSFEISSISSCTIVKNYHSGFGMTFYKRVYSVGGTKAVELRFKDSKKIVWLGTNTPEDVCRVINESMEKLNKSKKYN